MKKLGRFVTKLAVLFLLTIAAFSQTRTSTLSLNRIQYADQHAWTRFPVADLSSAGAKTITLAPCPYGLDYTNTVIAQFTVYISGVGTPEVANVTGGSGAGGAASCTINVTTVNTHSAGYKFSSSSGGIQEAINDAGTPNAEVIIPPLGGSNQYFVRSPIYIRKSKLNVSGYGSWLKCLARSGCIEVGETEPGGDTNTFTNNRIRGIRFASGLTSPAITITNHEITSNVAIMTTGSAHSFIVGDKVTIKNTFPLVGGYSFDGVRTITEVPNDTHFKFAVNHADITSAADVGAVALTHAAIIDNSNGLKLEDILISSGAAAPAGLFHDGIVVLNDQAMTLEKFSNEGSGTSLLCDATFCGSFIYGPGPFNTNAGIGYLRDLDIGGCSGNGIDWANGNTLHVTDSIIQAVKQFAIRSESAFDVNPSVQLDNVYLEVGACTNPVTGMGISGVIIKSGYAKVSGGEPLSAKQKLFANTGSSLQYNYFIVIKSSTNGDTSPYLAGYATLASASGTVNVYWPQEGIGGTVTYDVIRTSGTIAANPWPYTGICNTGGSTAACGSRTTASTGVTCALGVCTFADDASANTTAYTFSTNTYAPTFNFWPGSFVLGGGSRLSIDSLRSGVQAGDSMVPKVYATECAAGSRGQPGQIVCLAGDSSTNGFPAVGAMILQNSGRSGGTTANIKGRINFLNAPGASLASQDLITAVDTQREKTIATAQHRPSNDAADTAICLDQGSAANTAAQLCLRAPIAISNYINSLGDNASYKERLTSSLKTFTVPVSWSSGTAYLFSGTEQSAPSNPNAGNQRAYFKAGVGLCSRNSAGTEFCPGAGGGSGTVTSVALTVPAELTVTGSPIVGAGTFAMTWTAPVPTSAATANAIVKRDGSGNASFAALTADSISFSGAGPWAAESLRAAASAPSAGANSKVSFEADGKLYVWESDGATSVETEVAKVNSSITGNAATATAFAANPTDCSANQYANAISASGNLACNQVGYSQVSGTPTLRYQTVQDGGADQTQRSKLNFVDGANITVTCADNAGANSSDCTIAATGTTGYATVEEEAGALTQRDTINFIGAALTATDNGGSTRTDVTLSQSPASASVVGTGRTLTGGNGIAAIGDLSADRTINTASNEANFLTSGALTCGAATQGKMQVHTTPLQYCDNAGTPALQYAAYATSDGKASSILLQNVADPTANKIHAFGTNTYGWTFGNITAVNSFNILTAAKTGTPAINEISFIDTTGNTNTGSLFNLNTVGTSTATPFRATAQGTANGILLSTAGQLDAIGTGNINATKFNGNTTIAVSDLDTDVFSTTTVTDSVQASGFCVDAGANDTYACNLSPAITAYVAGTQYCFKANTENTGTASINFNAKGALTITKPFGGSIISVLNDNDIRANQFVCGIYDGTNFQMNSQVGNAPSGSGTVNAGTATHLAYYGGTGTAVSDMGADFTFASNTITAGASGKIDMRAGGANSFQVPSAAGAAPTADSSLDFNSTTHSLVWGSNGTTIVGAAAATSTNTATTCTNQAITAVSSVAIPTCTTITSAYVDNSVAKTSGTAKQVVLSGGASGNAFTTSDFPDVKIIPAANCVNGVAGSGWSSTGTGMPAACRAGTNNFNGVLQPIPSTGGTAYIETELPVDWDTATKPYISIYYGAGLNSAGTVIWTISTACTKQDGSITDDPAWIAESAMGTQTMANVSRMWAQNAQIAGAMTNCIGGSTFYIKAVLSGTASSAINVSKMVVTIPRLLTLQAN